MLASVVNPYGIILKKVLTEQHSITRKKKRRTTGTMPLLKMQRVVYKK